MANIDEINGCYGLGEKSTDFILTEGLLDALPTLYQQDEQIYQYNQGNQSWSKKSCTLFSPIGAISDLFNIEIPLSTIKEWDNDSYNRGRIKGEGWRVALGVEHIANKWNESDFSKQYGKVAYYSIELKDNELLKKVLEKRYSVCTGFQGNAAYNNDYKADGILNGTEFGKATYGHAINIIWGENSPSRVKDNYYGTVKYNIYGVENELSQISCFYERGYVFTKVAEDNLEEIKRLNEFRTNLLNAIEVNSQMRHQTNDSNYQSILHYMNEKNRKKVEDIDNELKKYI